MPTSANQNQELIKRMHDWQICFMTGKKNKKNKTTHEALRKLSKHALLKLPCLVQQHDSAMWLCLEAGWCH